MSIELPRSSVLPPSDYFLWGSVKSQIYKNDPQLITALKDEIIRVISEIEPQLFENVTVCRAVRGGHLADI